MIELFEQDVQQTSRQSSKGNQLKWKNDKYWYKADYTGYESLSEYMVSHLLQFSNLNKDEYIIYDIEKIKYKTQTFLGTKSTNFVFGDWQLITLERLYKSMTGRSLQEMMYRFYPAEERMKFLVNEVEAKTGMSDFGIYMSKLLTIDSMFLNEDRHLHNIAVLMNSKGDFAYCPIFDNGAALLSDTTMDYPLGIDVVNAISMVKSKTVSESFDEQKDIVEDLYGYHLKFTFTKQDVEALLEKAEEYPIEVRERVKIVIFQQMRKHGYLFP